MNATGHTPQHRHVKQSKRPRGGWFRVLLDVTSTACIMGMMVSICTGCLHLAIMFCESAWLATTKAIHLFAADKRYLDECSSHSDEPDSVVP